MNIPETQERIEFEAYENLEKTVPLLVRHFCPHGADVHSVKLHFVDGDKGTKFIMHIAVALSDGEFGVIRTLGNLKFAFLKVKKITGDIDLKADEDPFEYDHFKMAPTSFAIEAMITDYLYKRFERDNSLRYSGYYSDDLTTRIKSGLGAVPGAIAAHTANAVSNSSSTIPVVQPKTAWAGDW